MDVTPLRMFSDEQSIILATPKKGKVKATEPAKDKGGKQANTESNVIWEMKTFDAKVHDKFESPVSGDLSVRESLLHLRCSVNVAQVASSFAFSQSQSSCRRRIRI